MDITFVIPGNNRSGGVRATVCMANQLLTRGHLVRIAFPRIKLLTYATQRGLLRLAGIRGFADEVTGWLHGFRGRVERFRELDDLAFNSAEVVVAVGTLTIRHVYNLRQTVLKVRYNHGLLDNMTGSELEAWKLPMPTITVSGTITPDLERISGQRVLAVVPNGIDLEEYNPVANVKRDGIGSMFSLHPAKAPELLIRIFSRLRDAFPEIPRYAFGTEKCPAGLTVTRYWRYPSVEDARLVYNRSRIWLVASYSEGFPGPVLEAMACGCVVISSGTHGGRELICDGMNGLLFPPGDIEGCLRSIRRVFGDPDMESKFVNAGLKTAARLTWERAADVMEAFLCQLQAAEKKSNHRGHRGCRTHQQ